MITRAMVGLMLVATGCSRLFALEELPDPASVDSAVSDSVGADAPAETGLIAHYTMDSITGAKLVDTVGGHNGNCTSCPTLTSGPFAGALTFNGTTNAVDVVAGPTFATTFGLTVSVWLRLETTPGSTSLCAVSLVLGGVDNSWQLCADSGNVINAYWYQSGEKKLSGPSIGEDEWHHVALVWNGLVMALYVDGAPSTSMSAKLAFDGSAVVIGGDRDNAAFGYPWDGSIDELRIYNRALSADELRALVVPP